MYEVVPGDVAVVDAIVGIVVWMRGSKTVE